MDKDELYAKIDKIQEDIDKNRIDNKNIQKDITELWNLIFLL